MVNKELKNIDSTAKFSNFQVLNSDFIRCKCNVFYTGKNRNYTSITDEALQKFIERKGYANVPVVGHIKRNKDGKLIMGSHDRKIEISNDGIQEINECVAYGVIPLDCNPRMESIINESGIEKQYFTVDIILWSHYFPELMETTYNDEVYFNHSMEIHLLDTSRDGDYTVINDFSLQALCMLGKYDNTHGNAEDNSEPCFEDSRIKRFSLDEVKFKQKFSLMLDKYKKLSVTDDKTFVNNKETDYKKEEESKSMELNKFVKIFSTQKIENTDICKYRILNVSDLQVFALDMQDYKPYGFNYAVTTEDDTENLIVDFDSKVEMSLSATEKITEEDFEEFSIETEINIVKEKYFDENLSDKLDECTKGLEENFNKRIEQLTEAYNDISNSYSVAIKKLEEYEKAEEDAKIKAHREEINELFNKYSEKLGRYSEFLVYKAKCDPDKVTVDEVSEKLTLMVGKYTMEDHSRIKKNFSYMPNETNTLNRSNNIIVNKYGNLLDKYINI